MIDIKTKSGFELSVDENILNDMEFVDEVVAMQIAEEEKDEKSMNIHTHNIMTYILNPEDKKRLYNHIRTENGRVPVDVFAGEISEIMETLSEKSLDIKN